MCTRKGYIRSETYRVTTAGIPCGMTCDPNYRARIELLVNPTGHGPSLSETEQVPCGAIFKVREIACEVTFTQIPVFDRAISSCSRKHEDELTSSPQEAAAAAARNR